MTDWRERLAAVTALGAPPVPKDGEVACLNPTCRNEKLNRSDMTCWKCGGDRFAPASDEMRWALRFNYVPPPRRVEKPKEDAGPPAVMTFMGLPFQGMPFPFQPSAPSPQPSTSPARFVVSSGPGAGTYNSQQEAVEAIRSAIDKEEQEWTRFLYGPSVRITDTPRKPGLLSRALDWLARQ